jgi:thiol-disulfide isomerase/thioredoxin/sugar lactone lactonase YvrE
MKRLGVVLVSLSFILSFLAAASGPISLLAQADLTATGEIPVTPTAVQSYAGKVRAPEFPMGLDWINVDQPLAMSQLRGKVVLLDFWTYGCINCIHIIPDLKRLEAEFANELVVIGVHSAKFANEGSTANIRYIVQRYGVEHPVVNDKDYAVWQAYGVRAWPTSMLIDPAGKVLGYYSGEGVYDALEPTIKGMVAEFDGQHLIDRTPLQLAPELAKQEQSLLAFPGKVLADAPGNRLFISDSNHNRIVVADLSTYAVKAVIGGGAEGLQDGDLTTALFHWPQGLAVNGDMLYVADTDNHAIRAIDLKAGTVKTLAGTGQQGHTSAGGPALSTALNSPWDMVYLNDVLYIAMAGPHQLWTLDLKSGSVSPYAGSGREGIDDGSLSKATLAQPSGITTDGKVLYFADAESSAIRTAALDPAGAVKTIVGTGLFDFGDVDGTGDAARLQHALGLTLGPEGKLYVADTYNSKIKIVDPVTRESKTFLGGGQGLRDGKDPQFYEPGGITYANGKLYVADTNNNAIRIVDVQTRETSTLVFPNPEALNPPSTKTDTPTGDFFGDVVNVAAVQVAPGQGKIVLNISLPQGYKFNNLAPFTLHVYNDSDVVTVAPGDNDLKIVNPPMPVSLPATFKAGSAKVTLDAAIYYCEAVNESLCFPANLRFVVPLTVGTGGGADVQIVYTVVPPEVPKSTLGGQ